MIAPAILAAQDAAYVTDRLVPVLSFLLAGILVVGLGLILMTIFWGRRARREAQRTLPSQSAVDELWHLKGRDADRTQSPAGESDSE